MRWCQSDQLYQVVQLVGHPPLAPPSARGGFCFSYLWASGVVIRGPGGRPPRFPLLQSPDRGLRRGALAPLAESAPLPGRARVRAPTKWMAAPISFVYIRARAHVTRAHTHEGDTQMKMVDTILCVFCNKKEYVEMRGKTPRSFTAICDVCQPPLMKDKEITREKSKNDPPR